MELMPSLSVKIGRFQNYLQLSTTCQISRYSQCIARKIAICELDTIRQKYSNPRAYSFQLSTLYQILGDSRTIASPATICEWNTI
jgi:hypothetical protein